MKSTVIVFSFLLIAKIQQTRGTDEPGEIPDLNGLFDTKGVVDGFKFTSTVTSNPTEPKGQQTNQQNSNENADKMREKAMKDREAALNKAQSDYNKFVGIFKILLEEADKKRREEEKIVEHEHLKADIIATVIWRNAFQKWTNAQKNAENKYQETLSTINRKISQIQQMRDAIIQATDEHFVKTYAEAEENRKKAESENKEILVEGRTEYENAVKSARKMKSEAEKEFWSAASNYDKVTLEEWTQIAAKHQSELETYTRALQDAEKKWQNMLNQVGVGRQYEETINKAVTELVNAHKKTISDAMTAIQQYTEELKAIQNSTNDTIRLANVGKEKAEREFREALNKAKNEAQKKNKIIQQDEKKQRAAAIIYLKKVNAEFQKMKAQESTTLDEATKEASMIESATAKPT